MTAKSARSARLNRLSMRALKIGVVSGLSVMLLAESLSSGDGQPMPISVPFVWLHAAVSVFAIAVYALYRPGRKRWIAYVAFASVAVTVLGWGLESMSSATPRAAGTQLLGWVIEPGRGVGVAEAFAMLLLMLHVIRHWDAPPGRWVAFVLGAALVLIGTRFFVAAGSVVGGTVMIVMALLTVVAFGAYLRSLDKLRRETQDEVRRAERMELAREMHDFVAHHVTGIVVLAQAAQVTDTNPRKSFADIEEAGLAALASMRRMVKMLRAEDSGAGVNPLGDLSQIEDLVDRFSREGTDASCFISPDLAGKVQPEIAATAHRIVRESLTNIRKHAQGTKRVRVVVAAAGTQGVEVSVRDDGHAARKKLVESGGGYGLMGLGERVEAVGGQLRAERRPEGGWEVVAWLPCTPIVVG